MSFIYFYRSIENYIFLFDCLMNAGNDIDFDGELSMQAVSNFNIETTNFLRDRMSVLRTFSYILEFNKEV